jgi:hypothetical protein
MTVLEGIVKDIGEELYQKWYNGLAIEDRTEDASKAMAANAGETTLWVIQEFMNRFNSAAEALKDVDVNSN